VLRRAVNVYERLVRRFSAQTTDYQSLLSTFAEGLYTEMDFRNEALNAQRMSQLLGARWAGAGLRAVGSGCGGVEPGGLPAAFHKQGPRQRGPSTPRALPPRDTLTPAPGTQHITLPLPPHPPVCSEFATAEVVIPQPLMHLTTRRVLTMDWLTGVELTTLEPAELRELVKVGQEAFLIQLLDIGFFHGGEREPSAGGAAAGGAAPSLFKLYVCFQAARLPALCLIGLFLSPLSPTPFPPSASAVCRPAPGQLAQGDGGASRRQAGAARLWPGGGDPPGGCCACSACCGSCCAVLVRLLCPFCFQCDVGGLLALHNPTKNQAFDTFPHCRLTAKPWCLPPSTLPTGTGTP
jgi:hypothetical protein